MLLENIDQKIVRVTMCGWGMWLLLGFPILNALIYLVYVNGVDLEWVYSSKLAKTFDPQIAQQVLAKKLDHNIMWHWAKLALWPTVLYQVQILLIVIFSISFAQFFDSKIGAKKVILISVWSHVTLLLGMLLSFVNFTSVDVPVRMHLIDLNPVSWNRIFRLEGDGSLQLFTSFESPMVFLNIFILAYLFKRQSQVWWIKSLIFASLPYVLFLGLKYHIFGIVLSS